MDGAADMRQAGVQAEGIKVLVVDDERPTRLLMEKELPRAGCAVTSVESGEGALEQLRAYRWPGNVRELQNCIERAVILTDGDSILPRHLNLSFVEEAAPAHEGSPLEQMDLTGSLTDVTRRVTGEVEKLKIQQVLRETENNKGRAAEVLQVSYKTLLAKLKEHRIE